MELNENYTPNKKIGKGTYGTVYQAIQRQTGEMLAVKRIPVGIMDEGFRAAVANRAYLLKELHHENISRLLDMHHSGRHQFLVYDYYEENLDEYTINFKAGLHPDVVKFFLSQILRGLDYCHNNGIIHGALKPTNIFIGKNNDLKIADVGHTRLGFSVRNPDAHETTRWYQPPEVLLGSQTFTKAIDVWSTACIFAELVNGYDTLFRKEKVGCQIKEIFFRLGFPTEYTWPEVGYLPEREKLMNCYMYPAAPRWHFEFLDLDNTSLGVQLMQCMLVCNPARRISTEDALKHPYLSDM